MSPPPWRPSPTQIGTRTALEMPSKPTSSYRNRESSSRKSPSPPTQPRSELAAAAKSTSSTSKPPRAAKMGRRKAQSEGHLPVLLAVLVAQHGRPAKRIPTLRPLILSRLARPPPRLAACLGLSCPLVRGGARAPPGTRLFAHRVSPTSWTGCFFCRAWWISVSTCESCSPRLGLQPAQRERSVRSRVCKENDSLLILRDVVVGRQNRWASVTGGARSRCSASRGVWRAGTGRGDATRSAHGGAHLIGFARFFFSRFSWAAMGDATRI